jgi:hypothetical protein
MGDGHEMLKQSHDIFGNADVTEDASECPSVHFVIGGAKVEEENVGTPLQT